MSLRERFKLEELESKRLNQRKVFPRKEEPVTDEVQMVTIEDDKSEN